MQFDEEFLQYIWQFRLLSRASLFCTNGDALEIIHPGVPNQHAGPDFTVAKLRVDGQLWVGNVEIHLRASDWHLHHHQQDSAYDTVILHAVYEDDMEIQRRDGTTIPVLLLRGIVPEEQFSRYRDLLENRNPFPCSRHIAAVPAATVEPLLERMCLLRLEQKAAEVAHKLGHNHHDWNQTFFEMLARNFGFKVNALPFDLLAAGLHHTIIAKHRDNAFQVEALLFGQAGMLQGDFIDRYPQQLQAEYRFLQKKYALQPGDISLWKYLRMHPQNFPPLRIAQLSAFLTGRQGVFAAILEMNDLRELIAVFEGVSVHSYWKDHSRFDRLNKGIPLQIGKASVQSLLVNTICPLIYSYGRYLQLPELELRALRLLAQLPAERNAILSSYTAAGLKIRNAGESQAVLQLSRSCCAEKKCLHCAIGNSILQQPAEFKVQ